MMPGVSGLQLLQRLKREGHRLPAIMITGQGDVPMAVEAMKAGAADFIEKPIGRDELFAGIERGAVGREDPPRRSEVAFGLDQSVEQFNISHPIEYISKITISKLRGRYFRIVHQRLAYGSLADANIHVAHRRIWSWIASISLRYSVRLSALIV